MKKVYQSPETTEIIVAMSHHLMNASLTGTDASTDSNGDYNTLSREYDWDD